MNWEIGQGVYSAGSPPTMTRVYVEDSSSGPGTLQVLSGNATVSFVVTAQMYESFAVAGNVPPLQGDRNGIIIPFYLYPNSPYTDPTCQALFTLGYAPCHDVPVIVIVNAGSPSGGPGTG